MNNNQNAFSWTEWPAPAVDGSLCAIEADKGKWSLRIPVYAVVASTFRVRGPHAFAMYHPDHEARGATTTMTIR